MTPSVRARTSGEARPHLRRGQTSGDRLKAWGPGIRGNAGRRAVIGWTENDRLIGAHGGEVQDRAGARHQEQRPRAGPAAAQVGDQRLLGGLVQTLFLHVDNHNGRAIGFQSNEQRD